MGDLNLFLVAYNNMACDRCFQIRYSIWITLSATKDADESLKLDVIDSV